MHRGRGRKGGVPKRLRAGRGQGLGVCVSKKPLSPIDIAGGGGPRGRKGRSRLGWGGRRR